MLAEADLPEDIEALRAFALEQSRKLAEATLAKGEADAEVERLQSIIDAFMRHRFGRRSEQLGPDQLELGLEDIETALGQARAARDAASGQQRTARARNTNRGSLPAHLERIEQVVDVEDKSCPCCGGALHAIGEDVAERLDVVPTTFRVLVIRRPRYGCRSCEGAVVQAPAPARIVEGGIPTEALIAQVLVAKYADHLPLYRQAQICARQGIKLDRSTLADWVGRAAWYLRPLRDHTLEELRKSDRGSLAEQRRAMRDEHSRILVDDLKVYLDARLRQLSAKSKLAEAIRYAVSRWDGLVRFLDDGRIELDTNTVERAIRPLALNRNYALFAGSDEGGDNWAVIATFIENCKISGTNPHTWLTRTLTALANGHPTGRVAELMPCAIVA